MFEKKAAFIVSDAFILEFSFPAQTFIQFLSSRNNRIKYSGYLFLKKLLIADDQHENQMGCYQLQNIPLDIF